MTYDTPETVERKLANLATILAMWNHYFVADHLGDYLTCELCQPDPRRSP